MIKSKSGTVYGHREVRILETQNKFRRYKCESRFDPGGFGKEVEEIPSSLNKRKIRLGLAQNPYLQASGENAHKS